MPDRGTAVTYFVDDPWHPLYNRIFRRQLTNDSWLAEAQSRHLLTLFLAALKNPALPSHFTNALLFPAINFKQLVNTTGRLVHRITSRYLATRQPN
jgi:hypothetical protein